MSFPTLEIVGVEEESRVVKAAHAPFTCSPLHLPDYRWLIFTSANAVNFALKANGGKIAQFTPIPIAAIGKATEKALISAGVPVMLRPRDGFDSEALLAETDMQTDSVQGVKILIVKGQGGRDELAKVLAQRGCQVYFWEVYKRVRPDADCTGLRRWLDRDNLHAVVITSTESLRNLVEMTGKKYNNKLVKTPLIVISNRIKQFADELGFVRVHVAESPSDEAVLDAAIAIYNGE